jgi:hypothetical protein
VGERPRQHRLRLWHNLSISLIRGSGSSLFDTTQRRSGRSACAPIPASVSRARVNAAMAMTTSLTAPST